MSAARPLSDSFIRSWPGVTSFTSAMPPIGTAQPTRGATAQVARAVATAVTV
jgi:hypothetical protein